VTDESGLLPGQVLVGRFRMIDLLGTGGFGSVWRAQDKQGHDVAIKVLHPSLISSPKIRARFVREAQILQKIEHPNVVHVFDLQEDDNRLFIAMEYLPGRPLDVILAERAAQRAHFSLDDFVAIADQMCLGLGAAHSIGVIHRDLKPANVHLTNEAPIAVKVLDFGIARMLGGDTSDETTRGRLLGSPSYMSPEQVTGQPADRRTDVFALASVLFEVLTLTRAWALPGKPTPARGDVGAMLELFDHIASGPRARPRSVRPELDPRVDAVFARAWAANADGRYATVWELREALVDALGLSSTRVTDPRVTDPRVTNPRVTNPRAADPRAEPTMRIERKSKAPPRAAAPSRPLPTKAIAAAGVVIAIAVAAWASTQRDTEVVRMAAPMRSVAPIAPPQPIAREVPPPPPVEAPIAAPTPTRRAQTPPSVSPTPSATSTPKPRDRTVVVDGVPIVEEL